VIYPGIDLGTTYSLAAYVNAQGVPALFPDFFDASEFRTPSVVYIGESGALVGSSAEELLEDNPGAPISRFAKLKLAIEPVAYQDENGFEWSPESISALILRKIQRDIQAFASDEIGAAVVAVPAQFSDPQRKATRSAAMMAGFGNVSLVEEPVAAATFYGMTDKSRESTIFVYDLGGGTFDATVLRQSPDGLWPLACDGTNRVGGKVFDDSIISFVNESFKSQYGFSPMEDPRSVSRLIRLAESTKIRLSKPGKGQVHESLMLAGRPFEFLLTRGHFESLIDQQVLETIKVCEACLSQASLNWDDLDAVLLTGGSSLIPMVSRIIADRSGKSVQELICRQPHQAVAFGAAQVANDKGEGNTARKFHTIASYDLGLRAWDRERNAPGIECLVKRNTPLPAEIRRTVYTTRPDQNRIVLEFLQKSESKDDEVSLGHFAFGPIANPRKNYPTEITVRYEIDGTVNIVAHDPESGERLERILHRDGEITIDSEQRHRVINILIND
jgi:molecular chaperone DnaK